MQRRASAGPAPTLAARQPASPPPRRVTATARRRVMAALHAFIRSVTKANPGSGVRRRCCAQASTNASGCVVAAVARKGPPTDALLLRCPLPARHRLPRALLARACPWICASGAGARVSRPVLTAPRKPAVPATRPPRTTRWPRGPECLCPPLDPCTSPPDPMFAARIAPWASASPHWLVRTAAPIAGLAGTQPTFSRCLPVAYTPQEAATSPQPHACRRATMRACLLLLAAACLSGGAPVDRGGPEAAPIGCEREPSPRAQRPLAAPASCRRDDPMQIAELPGRPR